MNDRRAGHQTRGRRTLEFIVAENVLFGKLIKVAQISEMGTGASRPLSPRR